MKVGILTYHFAVNYGAVLQCYALQTAIKNMGVEAYVINYVSETQRNNNEMHGGSNIKLRIKDMLLLPYYNVRKTRYERFSDFRTLLNLTEKISTIPELKIVTDNNMDVVLVGSDQVWSPAIDDFDRSFFLPFETRAKKTAYAASVGASSASDLEKFSGCLKQFDYITVREESAKRILAELNVRVDRVISDPVFLLRKEEWINNLSVENQYRGRKTLVCYFLHQQYNEQYRGYVEEIANERNLEVINIITRFRKSSLFGECVFNAGPKEFISLLNNAEYICTDSFHGTAFAAILNRPFTSFAGRSEGSDSRKGNLLSLLGIGERICYLDKPQINTGDIDFDKVNNRINLVRENEIEAITEILS